MAKSGSDKHREMYGYDHRQRRKELAPLVRSGRAVCARCGQLIGWMDKWDLGHVDGDRTRYAGPEHLACNRATSGRGKPPPEPPPPFVRQSGPGRKRMDNATRFGWAPRGRIV